MSQKTLKIHFIAIGGSLMHSIAIAMKEQGHEVTGSDDEIYEPSRSNLENAGLLPDSVGWDTDRIHDKLDAVIVGMHARADNPELQKCQELNLKIQSAPEFIHDQSTDKQRIVIGGSHGKTTITSMVIHVLSFLGRDFDFALGAHVPGFNNMVKLTDAPIIVIEGDEYSSSPLDSTPKFLNYHHHIGLISGISWDHINVFPSEEEYLKPFESFADATPKGGTLVYCDEDAMASVIGQKHREDVHLLDYRTHPSAIEDGVTYLLNGSHRYPVSVFGRHNLQNIAGAMQILRRLSVSEDDFYQAIQSFQGADNRLELVKASENVAVFKDYAHSPSKVTASTLAAKEQYPDRELVACLELHTFSSLTKSFLPQYKNALRYANYPAVYFNPHTIEHKQLEPIAEKDVLEGFATPHLKVFTDAEKLMTWLLEQSWDHKNLLLMSSGTFNEMDIPQLANQVVDAGQS